MNTYKLSEEYQKKFIVELKEVLSPYNTESSFFSRNWGESKSFLNYLNWINYLNWARDCKKIKYCDGCGNHKFSWMKNYDKNQKRCKCGYYF